VRVCDGEDIYFFSLTFLVSGFLVSLVSVFWTGLSLVFLAGLVSFSLLGWSTGALLLSFFFFFLGLSGYLSGLRSLSSPVVI